jgi:hypothetical protein
MPDYSEVIAARERQEAERRAEHVQQRRMLTIVRTKLEDLLSSSDWDVYRTHVEALAERDAAQLAQTQELVLTGALVGDDLLRQIQLCQYLRGRADAFREALGVPDSIRNQATLLTSRESHVDTSAMGA